MFELFHFPAFISISTQSAHRRGTKRQSRKGQEVADLNLYHLLPRNHENPPWMRPCEKSHSSLKVGYLEWYWRSEDDVCNKLCLYFHISYYSFFQINAEWWIVRRNSKVCPRTKLKTRNSRYKRLCSISKTSTADPWPRMRRVKLIDVKRV